MRDLYLDFGTFTIRIVETMPGEPDEILTEDTAAPESDFGIEVMDAESVPGLVLHTEDRDRVILAELDARIAVVKARLETNVNHGHRYCRACQEPYYFNGENVSHGRYGNDSDRDEDHNVQPANDTKEDLLVLAQLHDMRREVFGRLPIS